MALNRCTFTPRPPLRPCREAMLYDKPSVTQSIEFCRHTDCVTVTLPRLVPEHDLPYWAERDDAPRWLDYVTITDEPDKCPCLETQAVIVVVGPKGLIIRSEDCGVTWEGMDTPPPIDWEAVAYCEGKLIAVGHGVKGAYSTDQGLTWSEFDIPPANWDAIACCGGWLIVMDSQGARLAVTDAAGTLTTWDDQPAPWDAPVAYHFCNCLGGTSVIAGGLVYKTIDGLIWAKFFTGEAEIVHGYWTSDLPGDVYVTADGLELREQDCCDDPETCDYGLSKPRILTDSIPSCLVNTVYNSFAPLVQIVGTDGWRPYTWSARNLPPGLTIEPLTGRIVGSPTTTGDYTGIEITLTDFIGQTAVRLYTMTVYALPIIGDPPRIITESIPPAATGQVYRTWIHGIAGTLPYRWTAIVKPDWLDIDLYTGELRGTVPADWSLAGTTVPITILLTDLNDLTDDKPYTLELGYRDYPGLEVLPGPVPPGVPKDPGDPGDPGGGNGGGGGGGPFVGPGPGPGEENDPPPGVEDLGGFGTGLIGCWKPDMARPSRGYTATFTPPIDGAYFIVVTGGGNGGGGAKGYIGCHNPGNKTGSIPGAYVTFRGQAGPMGGQKMATRWLLADQEYTVQVGAGGQGGDGANGGAGQPSSVAGVSSGGGASIPTAHGHFYAGVGGAPNNNPPGASAACEEYCKQFSSCALPGRHPAHLQKLCDSMEPCGEWSSKGGDGMAGSVCIYSIFEADENGEP